MPWVPTHQSMVVDKPPAMWTQTATPHSLTSTILLRHCLHPEHLAKTLMLGDHQCLGQDISHHVISPYELEVNVAIHDAFPNKVIPDVNMLCCCMVDRVLSKEVSSMVINIQSGWSRCTFAEFRKKLT